MRRFLVILLSLFSFSSKAQSVAAELNKVRENYLTGYLKMEVEVTGYKNEFSDQGVLIGTGKMVKSEDSYYSQFMNNEMLVSGGHTIVINHTNKSIAYFENKKVLQNPMSELNIEGLLAGSDSIIFKEEKQGQKRYCFYNKSATAYKTDLYIDTRTYLVSRITYLSRPLNAKEEIEFLKMDIRYSNVSITPFREKALFSEEKYIIKKHGDLVPADKYANYTLKVTNK